MATLKLPALPLARIYNMENYQIKNGPFGTQTGLIRQSDGHYIPLDPNNIDYQTYLVWIAAGGVPTTAEQPT